MADAKEIKKAVDFTDSATYIKLNSSDGKTFYVNKDVCMISKHLSTTLSSKSFFPIYQYS